MYSKKCQKCGFVSFAIDGKCKSCATASNNLPAQTETAAFSEGTASETRRRAAVSPLRMLILVLLILVPGWYYYQALEKTRIAEERKAQELKLQYAQQTQKEEQRKLQDCMHYAIGRGSYSTCN